MNNRRSPIQVAYLNTMKLATDQALKYTSEIMEYKKQKSDHPQK